MASRDLRLAEEESKARELYQKHVILDADQADVMLKSGVVERYDMPARILRE
jgi:hypothetical protein